MSVFSFQKLLTIVETVLRILLKAIDVLQGDVDLEPTPEEAFTHKDQ